MMGEDSEVAPEIIGKLRGLGVPFFRSPERALRALARLASLRAPQSAPSTPVAEPAGTRLPSGVIPEYAAKRILAEAGIPFPRAELVSDLHDAQLAAARIGYPVVLKAQSSALAHKSDVGGVVLDIADDASLGRSLAQARRRYRQGSTGRAARWRTSSKRWRARAWNSLLVSRNDPDWGPVLVIGLGGVWAEALRDVRVLPADLEPAAIVSELRQLKAALLLTGFRGASARDLGAVADIASRLGQFVGEHPEIVEIDVNPLVVYLEQEGAVAVDALIVAR